MLRRPLFFLLLFFIVNEISAQFYISGQEPSWIKWEQHNDDFIQLIYPKNLDSLSASFLGYMDSAIELTTENYSHKLRKFPVILHGNSILSNGFVTWAPKRMEIVTTPSFDASPEPWLLSLALHETRHVVQIERLNKGIVKIGQFLLGEQATGAAVGLVPLWYLEGDAVFAETEYSLGGRGRQASFYQLYRTHLLSHKRSMFSYDKWLLGSYKDQIPDHYQFGYQMIGYSNLKYGFNIWTNALDQVAKRPYSMIPFYFSLKRDIGLSRKGLFLEAFTFLDSLWTSNNENVIYNRFNFVNINSTNRDYVVYKYPQLVEYGKVVAIKESLKSPPSIVSIDLNSGDERKLFSPGYLTGRIGISSKYFLWTEYSSHPRWEYVNYSELWRYDIKNKKASKISKNTRYFNPIFLNGDTIAIIENRVNGENFIKILNINGEEKDLIPLPPTLEAKELCYGNKLGILVRCSSPQGSIIIRYKSIDSKADTLLGPIYWDISNISCNDSKLYFTKSHRYKEEAFSFDLKEKAINVISVSPYGLTNISYLEGDSILGSVYHENGSKPAFFIDHVSTRKSINKLEPNEALYPVLENNPLSKSSGKSLQSKEYSKNKNLIKIHSWSPFYYNPLEVISGNMLNLYPGATIMSQNLTSTVVSTLGYSYNDTHGVHLHSDWMGWYPIVSFGVDIGNEFALIQGGPQAPLGINQSNKPKVKGSGRIRIPYKLSSGYFTSELNLGVTFDFTNTMLWDYQSNNYNEGLLNIEPYLSVYAVTRMAHRDLKPRLGVYSFAGIQNSPFDRLTLGNSYILNWGIYLPGITRNHNTMINGQWEKQDAGLYIRSPRISYPRGHNQAFYEQGFSYRLNYMFPFLYPDLPIGPLVYLKRFYANLFFDNAIIDEYVFSNNETTVAKANLKSTGLEVNSDINLFRMRYNFRIGYRVGLNINNNQVFSGFLLSFDISNFYTNSFIDYYIK